MKELFKLFEKDIHSEHFSTKEKIIYGGIFPLAVFIIPFAIDALLRSWLFA